MMGTLFLICFILALFGVEARTLLENDHYQVKVGSGYGRHAYLPPPSPTSSPPTKEVGRNAHLPPPSPASSPPTKEVSGVSPTDTDEKSSENSELLMTAILDQEAGNQLPSIKKLFVSYVWNLIASSSCHDLEKYWRPRPQLPPSPKPSDHKSQIIIDSNFDNLNNYGREGGKVAPPAPEYDPPIHQVTSKGGSGTSFFS